MMSKRKKNKTAAAMTKLEWRQEDSLTRIKRLITSDKSRKRDLEAWFTTTMMIISEWLRRVQLLSRTKKWKRLKPSFKTLKVQMKMKLVTEKVLLRVKAMKGLKACSLDTNEAVIKRLTRRQNNWICAL